MSAFNLFMQHLWEQIEVLVLLLGVYDCTDIIEDPKCLPHLNLILEPQIILLLTKNFY